METWSAYLKQVCSLTQHVSWRWSGKETIRKKGVTYWWITSTIKQTTWSSRFRGMCRVSQSSCTGLWRSKLNEKILLVTLSNMHLDYWRSVLSLFFCRVSKFTKTWLARLKNSLICCSARYKLIKPRRFAEVNFTNLPVNKMTRWATPRSLRLFWNVFLWSMILKLKKFPYWSTLDVSLASNLTSCLVT